MSNLRFIGVIMIAALLFGCATRGDVVSSGEISSSEEQVGPDPVGAHDLDFARGVATANIGGQTYLFVTAALSDKVSVFSVANDGRLIFVDDIGDGERGANNLDQPWNLAIAVIGDQTYLFVSGVRDNAVSVFRVANDGSLTFVDDVRDGERGADNIGDAGDVATAIIGGQTYLFVAAWDEGAVSAFSVADDGSLSFVDDVEDLERGARNLPGANSLATAVRGGQTYLFVGADRDSDDIKNKAVSVFRVANNGRLSFVDDISDGEFGAENVEVATAVIARQTYLFVSVSSDGAVSVFSVGGDGSLTFEDYIEDEERGANNLNGAWDIATAVIGAQTYLFVPARDDGAVSVFSVADDGRLRFVDDIRDGERGADNLNGANDIATAVIGGQTYLFVAARSDDAVSVFRVRNDGELRFVDDVKHGNLFFENEANLFSPSDNE